MRSDMHSLAFLIRELGAAMKSADAARARTRKLWREFSAKVREERLRRGWILKDLARKTGIGQGTLHYLEHNQREWTLERAKKVMKAFK